MTLMETAVHWIHSGHELALAIVIETWGSAPRQAGAVMLVRDDSHIEGSVSGGCVEADVIETAKNSIETNQSFIKEFGVADETAFAVGLSCGGRIAVLIVPVNDEAFPPVFLERIAAAVVGRNPLDLIISLENENRIHVEAIVPDTQSLSERETQYNDSEHQLIWRFRPSYQIILIGAGHISQVLSRLASQVDFSVDVIDPRSMLATAERFPDVNTHIGWPQDLLPGMTMDAQTAMVTLTHNPEIDDSALLYALGTEAFYLGCLGSRRTHGTRCRRLESKGMSQQQLARLHGPAGIPLGGRGVSEIALAILAEIVQVRYTLSA